MKAYYFLIAGCLLAFASCHNRNYYRHHDNNISISVEESDDEYQMIAFFDEDKTKQVQSRIDEYTGHNGIFRSGNVEIDATTTLEDNVRVYIRSRPGRLKIKFDKEDNSEAACEKVKEMCEEIKEYLTNGQP
ncbi:hypothetical protein [Ferruginibacter sp.]